MLDGNFWRIIVSNSYLHNVDFPDRAKIYELLIMCWKKNSDSYCKYSEKSEILHELWKETKAFSKF